MSLALKSTHEEVLLFTLVIIETRYPSSSSCEFIFGAKHTSLPKIPLPNSYVSHLPNT